jgi:hypothetical protein
MGFFSWITQDSQRSIANQFSIVKPFTVYMLDNKGNVWKEDNYEGYGIFGGKDFYELLAEMNGLQTRDEGIDLVYKDENKNKPFLSPNLNEYPNRVWKNTTPEDCPDQGYFYSQYDDYEEDEIK